MSKLFQVDAFTSEPFKGNPAGVVLLQQEADEAWMKNVAAEMNLSETAFVVPQGDVFNLRWFTPTVEEDLCGHATLATAHILFEQGILKPRDEARFNTLSGLLTVRRSEAGLEMDFPAEPEHEISPPPVMLKALGVPPVYTGKNRMDILVRAESADMVRNANPDMKTLADIPVRGFIVTAPSDDPRYDFISRFFAPRDGITEDPVTGSAHCCLGPHWQKELGKNRLQAYQASQRGGHVDVECRGDRVLLRGQALTIFSGELHEMGSQQRLSNVHI